MKQTFFAIVSFAAAVLLSTTALAQSIKLGTLAPQNSPYYDILRDLAESWAEISNGTIRFRIYPGGVAGDDPDMVRKMRIGQLDAALLAGSGLAEIAPEIKALQLPMLFANNEEWDYVRTKMAPRLERILADKGFTVLVWGDAGWVYLFTQEAVVTPDDLKPLRLFVWSGDPGIVQGWRNLGYHPVPLAVNEIHSGLHSGLIHAYTTTPLASLSFQWFALAHHMTDLKWAPLVGAIVIADRKWKAIPDEIKPELLRSAQIAGQRFLTKVRHHNADAVRVMKEHGLVVHPVPSDVRAEWETRFRANYPVILGEAVPKGLVVEAEQLRDQFRTTVPSP
ncbi:TRAP transporter substrate-binding protein [Petrachloros mirabilis]